MVHLAVHLPEEALLRGPVQYGWMYPVERRLYTLKRYVRNRARPEGSIAEAYIADECLTFCSRYMDDVETIFNRKPRNIGFSDEEAYGVDVFGHGVNFTSGYEYEYVHEQKEFDQMVWYVLNNCDQAKKYIEYVVTSETCACCIVLYICDLETNLFYFTVCSEMSKRGNGCRTVIKSFNKNFRHGSGTMLVFIHI